MMPYEDIRFQLVDLPAISPEHPVSWLASALQTADACLLVVDLGDPACVERIEALHAVLRERRVTLTDRWEPEGEPAREGAEVDEDPFALRLPAVLLANRADVLTDVDTELRAFLELTGIRYRPLRYRPPQGAAWGRSVRCFSANSGSCVSTGQTAGPGPAVLTAPRADRGGRCAARAQGCGALAKVRAGVGQSRVRRPACRPRPSVSRWRSGRVAHVRHWWNSVAFVRVT